METIKRHYDEFWQGITQERADTDILSLEIELQNTLCLEMGVKDEEKIDKDYKNLYRFWDQKIRLKHSQKCSNEFSLS